MKRDVVLYLKDILSAINNIETFLKGVNKNNFIKNIEKQSAIVKQLEIIGEAVKNIPKDLREKHLDIPWKDIASFKGISTHTYFRLNLNMVWRIIEEDIPDLKEKIEKIKEDLEKEFKNKKTNKK